MSETLENTGFFSIYFVCNLICNLKLRPNSFSKIVFLFRIYNTAGHIVDSFSVGHKKLLCSAWAKLKDYMGSDSGSILSQLKEHVHRSMKASLIACFSGGFNAGKHGVRFGHWPRLR